MKKWIEPIAVFSLTMLLFLVSSPHASAAVFSDVPPEHWAHTEIQEASERGLVQGIDGSFHPDESVSVQAFLSMLCRASGLNDRALESGANWSEPAIAYGSYFGWFDAEEVTDETRTQPITREFAAKLLVNALFPDQLNSSRLLSFRDAYKIDRTCVTQVKTAVQLGLISGYADGTFNPKGPLSRAEAAVLLHRALERKESDELGNSIQVPILMYHDVSYLGSGYSKTPEIFKAQMQELKDAGFNTIFYSELIDSVEHGTPLPEKPIIISVDDGYKTNYTYLFPILEELEMRAEIALIGNAILYADWGMSWDEVREMAASGLVSFQSHTKNLHADRTAEGGRLGALKLPDESWLDYVTILSEDTTEILDLIEREAGTRPQVFTYPHGKWNAMSEAVTAQLGCKASVTTLDGIATVTQGDAASLRLMPRIGMDFRNGSVLSVLSQFGYEE